MLAWVSLLCGVPVPFLVAMLHGGGPFLGQGVSLKQEWGLGAGSPLSSSALRVQRWVQTRLPPLQASPAGKLPPRCFRGGAASPGLALCLVVFLFLI